MSDIVVEPETNKDDGSKQTDPRRQLVSWVMSHVEDWRTKRESTFRDKWDEYYRIWRGRWHESDRSRRSERSKIISPASQIAIDLAVAEMMEAIFSREQLFDIADDLNDQERDDAIRVRDQLIEDLRKDGIVECLQEVVLQGALYGQFIAKIATDIEVVSQPKVFDVEDEVTGERRKEVRKVTQEKIKIYPVPVEPGQLVVDPSGNTVEDMLGAAHEFKMPIHKIRARQANGTYYGDVVVGAGSSTYTDDRKEDVGDVEDDGADIVEWHGLVPSKMLTKVRGGDEIADAIAETVDEDDMVEAIVTIANGGILLRAIPNPSVMDDRAIVSEQFDTVPNRFWGRSVMEKGYNMQKALDAELRSRADGLAWVNNPMIAGDITKLPPNMNLNSWPGKFWGTKGDPREALTEFRFGDVNTSTFQQAADLERMLQQATGQVDPSVIAEGVRDQATGASALNLSGIVKRNKRAMLNMEVFLTKLIRRIAWRKMQLEPDRYPMDYEFVVRGTVGIMAREVEQQQLVQVLQFVDKGTPEYFAVLRTIFERSTMADKAPVIEALNAAMQPPSEEEQQKQQAMQDLQMQTAQAELRKTMAEAAKAEAEAEFAKARAGKTATEVDLLDDKMVLETARLRVDIEEADNQARQIAISERKQQLDEARFRSES